MKKLIFILLMFNSVHGVTQNQGNNWYFGYNAGITFINDSPQSINGGQINNMTYNEGSSSISDDQGNLLMYTNGETLWNRLHEIMLNGDSLNGNFSTTQSSIIIPQPKSNRYFYVFTMDDEIESTNNYGFNYSLVDICLDNGLGGVIPGQKNKFINLDVTEKIAACKHANGIDYWVVTQSKSEEKYRAYLLTQNGIMDTIETVIGDKPNFSQGQMKFSPDGTKLVTTSFNGWGLTPYFELFNFDSSNGIISNRIVINNLVDKSVYGVEFSADGSKLYNTSFSLVSAPYFAVIQHDLSITDETSINNSEVIVYQLAGTNVKGLQIGPDDKIYLVGLSNWDYLMSIDSPNLLGTSCQFNDSSVYLNPNSASYTLPTFVAGYNYHNIKNDCTASLSEITNVNSKYLLKILDLMGRETKDIPNKILIYIYSDGSTEKKYRME